MATTKLRTVHQRFTDLSQAKKWLIGAGSVAAALVALASAGAVVDNIVETHRPYAKRAFEITVAQVNIRLDLQEKLQIKKQIFDIQERASRERRPLTRGEKDYIAELEQRLGELERRK
jgi:hypothetical protein